MESAEMKSSKSIKNLKKEESKVSGFIHSESSKIKPSMHATARPNLHRPQHVGSAPLDPYEEFLYHPSLTREPVRDLSPIYLEHTYTYRAPLADAFSALNEAGIQETAIAASSIVNGAAITGEIPQSAARYLFDYQIDGIKWLWGKYCARQGCILGDDMVGYYSTVQYSHDDTLNCYMHYYPNNTNIIIMYTYTYIGSR
jgi:SNF2 family DNA or RNA helicase